MTEIDLGFNPAQPRDQDGKWSRGGALTSALKSAPPGSVFETTAGPSAFGKAMEGETGTKHAATFTSNKNGNWDGPENWGSALSSETLSTNFKAGRVLTPADQRVRHDRMMNKRDRARLARGGDALDSAAPGSTFTAKASTFEAVSRLGPGQVTLTRNSTGGWDTGTVPRGQTAKELHGNGADAKNWSPTMTSADIRRAFGTQGHVTPPTRKASPMDKRTRAQNAKRLLDKFLGHPGDTATGVVWSDNADRRARRRLQFSNLTEQDVIDLSNFLGREIDLDWTKWNQGRKGGGAQASPAHPHRLVTRRPAAGNARAKVEVKAFKRSAGLKGASAVLGKPAMAALKRRAAQSGHFRAKAILAASRGHVNRAQKFEAAHKAAVHARHVAAQVATTKPHKAPKPPKAPHPLAPPRPPQLGGPRKPKTLTVH